MRKHAVAFCLVGALLASCGSQEAATPTVAPTTAATPAGTETDATITSPPDTTTTSMPPVASEPATPVIELTFQSVGPVPIGEVADVAIPQLTGILGSPDRDEVFEPGSPCPPDAPWFRCACDRTSDPAGPWGCLDVATELRSMHWAQLGLTLIFRDHIVIVDGQEVQGPVQLAYWQIERPSEGEPLTVEGIGPGMLVSDLRRLRYAMIWFRWVATLPSVVEVSLWAEGTYFVGVEWNGANPRDESWYLAEVQRALNAHGAELDISGVADEPTQRAWDEFCREHDLECWFDEDTTVGGLMLAELELPPPNAAIAYMISGGAYSIRY